MTMQQILMWWSAKILIETGGQGTKELHVKAGDRIDFRDEIANALIAAGVGIPVKQKL